MRASDSRSRDRKKVISDRVIKVISRTKKRESKSMKRNEKLNVTDARMERATAAPSGSAEEIATPQESTEGNKGKKPERREHGRRRRQTRTNTERHGQGQTDEQAQSRGDGFISKKELAFRLKVTVRTISNWQRRGLLPFVKCRRAIYYDWPAVAAHLRARARICKERPVRVQRVMRIPVIGVAGDGRPQGRITKAQGRKTNVQGSAPFQNKH